MFETDDPKLKRLAVLGRMFDETLAQIEEGDEHARHWRADEKQEIQKILSGSVKLPIDVSGGLINLWESDLGNYPWLWRTYEGVSAVMSLDPDGPELAPLQQPPPISSGRFRGAADALFETWPKKQELILRCADLTKRSSETFIYSTNRFIFRLNVFFWREIKTTFAVALIDQETQRSYSFSLAAPYVDSLVNEDHRSLYPKDYLSFSLDEQMALHRQFLERIFHARHDEVLRCFDWPPPRWLERSDR